MNGLDLIINERKEQLVKHNFTKEHDKMYTKGELYQAAIFCFEAALVTLGTKDIITEEWPKDWDLSYKDKLLGKSFVGKMVECGALMLAEYERTADESVKDNMYNIAAILDAVL